MRIMILGAFPDSIIKFRGVLIEQLVLQGHDVVVSTAYASSDIIEQIEAIGARFVGYKVERNGLNPLADLSTLWQLLKLFRAEQPDKILAYTIKPIIWGGIAAKLIARTQFYAMITGLGYAFEKGSFKRRLIRGLVKCLYRFSLCSASKVIFQNNENKQIFIDEKLVNIEKTSRVYGSGVSLTDYAQKPLPDKPVTFLLIARLLGDKGIREYAQAAQQVKAKYPEVNFQLVGPFDPSPDGLKSGEVAQWNEYIDYLGEQKDVRPFIEQCHIYTLPSYHEGLPRTVLEAMAIGRPILTTDVPGCRDTVINGKNGKLVPSKNVDALANAMLWFIENSGEWPVMAHKSREFVEAYFDVNRVNQQLFYLMELNVKCDNTSDNTVQSSDTIVE
ncbi:glycosyltransferase family 4 protein [Thalassotalea euphylliae]|uniref:Glycosyltransferase family 1 protein n=1 Tax=Thalassotalea euphylliae TaxID=1655234 RepID=A0A3E0U4R4_9GAMM|nr:glycosyltransferase family 4 protein [Thalassotalea euphylliae]REL31567.1 glycosyltransferase family 1 protein [Thalassotalea euphylliae]